MIIMIHSKSTNHSSNYTFLSRYSKPLKQLRKNILRQFEIVSNILTFVLWNISLHYVNFFKVNISQSGFFFFFLSIVTQCLISLLQKWDFTWLPNVFSNAIGIKQEAYARTKKKVLVGQNTKDQNFTRWFFSLTSTSINKIQLKVH